jgi:hypothetical protein
VNFSPQRQYDPEDVQQILNLALAQRSQDDTTSLSYAQLLEIAEEMRIPAAALADAERQWLALQGDTSEHEQFQLARQSKFNNKLAKYVVTNSCLVGLNFVAGFGVPWSLYILLLWSIGMGTSAWRFYSHREGEKYDRDFHRWQLKQKIQTKIITTLDRVVRR